MEAQCKRFEVRASEDGRVLFSADEDEITIGAEKRIHLPMREMQFRSLNGEDPPGGGNDHPLQCSCLGNPMDGGASWAI